MGQFHYNSLRNNRIKAIALGLIVMWTNVLVIYSYYVTAGKDEVNVFYVVTISVLAIGLSYMLGLIPFGQVMEKGADGQVAIYYKLGKQKLKSRTLGKFVSANLQQDPKKFYCLTVKIAGAQILVLEKYPTLIEANERLEEFRRQIM